MDQLVRRKLAKEIRKDNVDYIVSLIPEYNGRKAIANILVDNHGNTVLHASASHGSLRVISYLVGQEAGLINVSCVNKDGKTALHEAALRGNLTAVKLLVKTGFDVNALKRADWTPLMLAAASGHLDVVQYLVGEAKANVDVQNKDGWTAFHIACRGGFLNIVAYLCQVKSDVWQTISKNRRTPFHSAALQGRFSVVEYIITNKLFKDLDERDECGNTPFLDSVTSDVNISKLLICAGCNAFLTDNLGRNALHKACEAGAEDSVSYLINSLKFDVNEQCERLGFTGLHYAAKEGHIHVVKLLLKLGGQNDVRDYKGKPPSDISLDFRHQPCFEMLVVPTDERNSFHENQ